MAITAATIAPIINPPATLTLPAAPPAWVGRVDLGEAWAGRVALVVAAGVAFPEEGASTLEEVGFGDWLPE